MSTHSGEDLRICVPEDNRHGRASGEACDKYPSRLNTVFECYFTGNASDQRRLPFIAPLVLRSEPVPTPGSIRGGRLLGIGDEKPIAFRKMVHTRASGKIFSGLRTTVHHHHQ
jgi:hypothetical protein